MDGYFQQRNFPPAVPSFPHSHLLSCAGNDVTIASRTYLPSSFPSSHLIPSISSLSLSEEEEGWVLGNVSCRLGGVSQKLPNLPFAVPPAPSSGQDKTRQWTLCYAELCCAAKESIMMG